MDTIYALASAQGKAGVAVVRISGPSSFAAIREIAGRLPEVRRATLMTLRGEVGDDLDRALVLTFAEKASFTGEQSAELHLHGSRATITAVLRRLSQIPGLRQAEAGEFTRRALENGRLDLAEVEGLADLIDAETDLQRRQALRLMSGALGEKAARWRANLIKALALLEVTIDFVDEEVPTDVSSEVLDLIRTVCDDLKSEASGVAVAERVRDGFEVAIIGPPNIGKSTLLNALAGREAAITSEIAGTTRDIVEVRMDLNGLPVTFLDTAGLREAQDAVEALGVARALDRAKQADMRVILIKSTIPGNLDVSADDIVLKGKADINGVADGISGKTGEGVPQLLESISSVLTARSAGVGVAVQERHRVAIMETSAFLTSAFDEISCNAFRVEIASEEIRHALLKLDILVGKFDVENVLDEIFLRFCLGK